jgi:hypothetical protein
MLAIRWRRFLADLKIKPIPSLDKPERTVSQTHASARFTARA